MTSKNKYIKTLDKFLDIMKSKSKPSFYENEKDQIAEDLITACKKADLYDELTQEPTFKECIKEWEKLGYTGSIDKLRIHMYKQLFGVTTTLNIIHIFRSEDRRYDFNMDGYFTKEESILLTKTLKALEEMKDE